MLFRPLLCAAAALAYLSATTQDDPLPAPRELSAELAFPFFTIGHGTAAAARHVAAGSGDHSPHTSSRRPSQADGNALVPLEAAAAPMAR